MAPVPETAPKKEVKEEVKASSAAPDKGKDANVKSAEKQDDNEQPRTPTSEI